jgi:hypothetical protein
MHANMLLKMSKYALKPKKSPKYAPKSQFSLENTLKYTHTVQNFMTF